MSTRGTLAKNNKTRFLYVLYSDKTWVFDQSEHAQGPIYVINFDKENVSFLFLFLQSKRGPVIPNMYQRAFQGYTECTMTSKRSSCSLDTERWILCRFLMLFLSI